MEVAHAGVDWAAHEREVLGPGHAAQAGPRHPRRGVGHVSKESRIDYGPIMSIVGKGSKE